MNLHPGKHRTPANICTILDQRWADAVQMPYKCPVPAGIGQKLSDCRYIINMKITVSHQTLDIEPMPVNVAPPSATPDQHQSGTGPTSGICWEKIAQQVREQGWGDAGTSSSTSGPHQANNGSTSGTCWVPRLSNTDPLIWWAIIIPTLDRHLTSAVKYICSVHHSSKRRRPTSVVPMPGQRRRR